MCMILTPRKFIRLLRKNCLIKRAFFFSLLLFAALNNGSAQLIFEAGPVIGIQGSQISGDNFGGYNQPGVYAGLYTNVRRNDEVSFQIEVSYSQKGARKIPNARLNDFTSYNLRLNYIEVPFYFRRKFKGFSFDFGFAYGQLLNYFEDNQFGQVMPVRAFRKTDFGGLLGAGYQIREHLTFSVRVVRSLIPVRNHTAQQAFWWNPGQLNNALLFSLSYKLGKKGN
jgi:hypothetical protein